MSRPAHQLVLGAELRGRQVKVPLFFHPDLFEAVRRRAERERSSFGELVIELVERGMGG